MFAFLRPKLATFPPAQFHDAVVIGQPAELVYSLIDWASPTNALRARGSRVAPVEGVNERYCLTMDELPGHRFDIVVTDAVPHSTYGFETVVAPTLGRMAKSHELYSVEPLGLGSCRVTLVNTMLFVPMRPEDMGTEELMVSAACHNALAKLKLQAEEGVEAVKTVAGKLVV
jgi:hypothetical protein